MSKVNNGWEVEWVRYRNWLLKKVKQYRKLDNYSFLFEYLHNYPFSWSLSMDENRAEDGKYLRENFEDEMGIPDGIVLCGTCTTLEMLVALAIRMDKEYIGEPGEPDPSSIFIELLNNLGLWKYDNRRFTASKVNQILQVWMSRSFEYNGKGSLFPLKEASRDQRKIEIWDQMNAYIYENYFR